MQEVIRLTQKLIRIRSFNPPGEEKEIALFIRDYLKKLGIEVSFFTFMRKRPNVVARISSSFSRKTLLITTHIDTVPASRKNWLFPPLSGKIYKGKIYGRGATDDKGNTAVVLAVIKKMRKENIQLKNLDLVFAFTVDEETGSKFGIIPLLKCLKKIDYGLVLDSDNFKIVNSQKGVLHLRIEILGKEAHGAYPERGINAIEKAVFILKDILQDKILKKTTINIGKIEGGEKVNIVAGYVSFELDIRYLSPLEERIIIERIKKIIRTYGIRFKLKILASQEPFYIDKKHFLIKTLKKVLENNRMKVEFSLYPAATVVSLLKERKIPCFSFGFGDECAHRNNEFVRIKNLERGVKILKEYIELLDERV